MTGQEFLDFARKIIVMYRGSPAAMRTVVSRAYYAVYHIARTFLEDLGFHAPKDESCHRFVLIHLANADNQIATDVAALLGEIHERRKKADYELDQNQYGTEAFAADAIARADRAVRLLDACVVESTRANIRDGILSYRAKISRPSRN